jgi:hypothetical protein
MNIDSFIQQASTYENNYDFFPIMQIHKYLTELLEKAIFQHQRPLVYQDSQRLIQVENCSLIYFVTFLIKKHTISPPDLGGVPQSTVNQLINMKNINFGLGGGG